MASQHSFSEFTGYGKTGIRLLKIKRLSEKYHNICEVEVCVELKLHDKNDYLTGDNSSVIPTDTQRNTVYALATKHELNSIEEFAIHICEYFLNNHSHVDTVIVDIEESPWQRIKQAGLEHAHSFIMTPDARRFCHVSHERGENPKVSGGLMGMKVLKTTQSGFTGFLKDQYTILPEVDDRCFSTTVLCKYDFDHLRGVNYNNVWDIVKNTILDLFAGPAHTGVYSASVQHTSHMAAVSILGKVPQIGYVEIVMPNSHYFNVNMVPFGINNRNEVLQPVDKPSGVIKVGLSRQPKAKL